MTFPEKLKKGDLVRVVAPASSLGIISEENRKIANQRFEEIGLRLSFGEHVEEMNDFHSSSIESRVADLHAAFADPEVKMIMPVIGGFNSNQLLQYLDWELIRNNPKILCGYSDITALNDAIYTKTGIVSYSGLTYSSFAEEQYFDYTLEAFKRCLFSNESFEVAPSETWSDDSWYRDQAHRNPIQNEGYLVINEGSAEATLLGGNLCTLNLLQGTEYMPELSDSILFLEDDETSEIVNFDRDLQSLIHQPGFNGVKGIVIGRFQKASKATGSLITQVIKTKRELDYLPVIANVDFGHTQSMITYPIGGTVKVRAEDGVARIEILKH
jgi:muramoyltetrapeptide carboxypeptidase LdcA involved in peptidoglycan recycling